MKPARLIPLLQRAQQQQTHAARALAQQQQLLHQHQQRLAELQCYRDEYADVPSTLATLESLLSYRSFVQRLNYALEQQQRSIAQQQKQLHNQQQRFLSARQATQKLEHLLQQSQAREQHIQTRQATRQLDDLAAYRTFQRHQPL